MDDTLPRPPDSSPTLPSKISPRRWLIPALLAGLLVVALVAGGVSLLLALARTIPVTVAVDGEAYLANTRAATVAQLLLELNIPLVNGDLVSPPLDTPITPEMIVRVERARSVMLTVNGETRFLQTPYTNPADILQTAGVALQADDRIIIDGTPTRPEDLSLWSVPVMQMSIRHALPLHIVDDGEQRTVRTTGETVGEALFEAGVTLYLADTVSPDLTTPTMPDLEVTITRARPITIVADGERVETRSRGGTVAGALADAGITLAGLDYTIPAESDTLEPGMSIYVIRVREEIIIQERSLPYETVVRADPDLELDQRGVAQEGREGIEQTRIRVRYEDGVETERLPESTVVIRPPEDRILTYGTNVILRTIDTPDGPRTYWRRLRMYATSYHPAALGGDNRTATGTTLQRGVVAADRRVLPFGTEIFVPGYGAGVVQDTAPPRRNGMWVDLGYSDSDYRPWSRTVDVYLLGEPPATIDYTLGD